MNCKREMRGQRPGARDARRSRVGKYKMQKKYRIEVPCCKNPADLPKQQTAYHCPLRQKPAAQPFKYSRAPVHPRTVHPPPQAAPGLRPPAPGPL